MSDSLLRVVREAPPLRLYATIETPGGNTYRWGVDEPKAANVLSDVVMSSTMPGGFENGSCTLARNPSLDYADLAEFSTLKFCGVGGQVAGEYRLEDTPRTSGSQMAITPQAVGWQAHLQDDNSAAMIYLDQLLSNWQDMPVARQLALTNAGYLIGSTSSGTDTSGMPMQLLEIDAPWSKAAAELWYDSGMAAPIAKVYLDYSPGAYINVADTNWAMRAIVTPNGQQNPPYVGNNLPLTGGSQIYSPSELLRYAVIQQSYGAAVSGSIQYQTQWRMAVVGNHGLTIQGAWPTDEIGLFASDIIGHAVGKWAPLLRITDAAGSSTITASTFAIPQASYLTPVTVSQIVSDLTAYELQDWAVWENKTFFWYPRNARGRRWRTRVTDCQLQETGPQSSRIWNGVIVSYQDVTGLTQTVGPPGSGATTEDASLLDTDPANPANAVLDASGNPIRRWSPLSMTSVSTPAGAIQVGAVFLREQKLLDTSGQANIVGYIEDEFGVLHPAWAMRAGDQIAVVDAADTSYRRIVSAEYTDSSKTNAINLDSPPDGLQALLDRLGVVVQPLGF